MHSILLNVLFLALSCVTIHFALLSINKMWLSLSSMEIKTLVFLTSPFTSTSYSDRQRATQWESEHFHWNRFSYRLNDTLWKFYTNNQIKWNEKKERHTHHTHTISLCKLYFFLKKNVRFRFVFWFYSLFFYLFMHERWITDHHQHCGCDQRNTSDATWEEKMKRNKKKKRQQWNIK